MADNDINNPALETDQNLNGSSGADSLTGGFGNDTLNGGDGNDVLAGDGPVPGAWHFETYNYDFTSANDQAFDIENGTLAGSGYVTGSNQTNFVDTLANSVNGTSTNPSDYGHILTNTISITTGGTYRFETTSDDGSTIQIFDSAGNPVSFNNDLGGTLDYMNNDRHQGPTTRGGDAILNAGETYTIQIRYWENLGGEVLSARVSGPDTGNVNEDLLTSPMLAGAPGPEYSVTGNPAGVEGNDVIYAGAGDDTVEGNGGNDTVFGMEGNDSILGGDGNDTLDGDAGADTILGEAGDDQLIGDAGNDSMVGGAGSDTLFGGADDDMLLGGDGDDSLFGGPGADTLVGGSGNDDFFFNAGDGNTLITDFNTGNTGGIFDGDQSNNDFIDLAPYYTSIFELRNDIADDGLANQSLGDFSDNTAMGGAISFAGTSASDLTFDNTNVACFTPGARVITDCGEVLVEQLREGVRVMTRDMGFQPVLALLSTPVDGQGDLAPVHFAPGAIGNDVAFMVSPQHRMLVRSVAAELLFTEAEVLVPAHQLVNGKDITRRPGATQYVHVVMPGHQIICVDGVWSESFDITSQLRTQGGETVADELLRVFPDLKDVDTHKDGHTCRRVLKAHEASLLVAMMSDYA